MYLLGVDLGATNVRALVTDETGRAYGRAEGKTGLPASAEAVAGRICDVAREAVRQGELSIEDVASIGVGTPGVVDTASGTVSYAGSMGFHDVPLALMVEAGLGRRTHLCNDANAAAWGEYLLGAGQGSARMACVTLGTGIGCGLVIDGALYTGANGAAGELGHMVIVPEGLQCHCGRRGCFELYGSATGLTRLTRDAIRGQEDSLLHHLAEGDLGRVDGKTAFAAARLGDAAGMAVVETYTRYLSMGLTNLVNLLQPDIVCLGGGLSNEGDALLDPVRSLVEKEQYARGSSAKTKLVLGKLKNDAGLLGAALFPLSLAGEMAI